MSIHYNGQNIKEMYYNGQKIKEAYYNGEKVFSGGGNVLFDEDITFGTAYTLPSLYPIGSIVEWTPAGGEPQGTQKFIVNSSSRQRQAIPYGETTITATIAFDTLAFFDTYRTHHIKITAGA